MNAPRHSLRILAGLLALLVLPVAAATHEGPRITLSLDGQWQIAEGNMTQPPKVFARSVPVPGLVSLAVPPFTPASGPKVADRRQLAQKDPSRDAFWYRRTFVLDRPVPAVARLKVSKAMFGTAAFLNGHPLGEHLASFTPGYFDARPGLKQGTNELLIRVGADRDAVGPGIPSGFDYEKERYIPGIFDSVHLILSGTPHFLQVQACPAIASHKVRVQALLRNDAGPARATVRFVVREARSGREVGRVVLEPVHLNSGAEIVLNADIPIRGCRLWSPEDPFLYQLVADSGTDRFETRFGMRQFELDPVSGRARLNGKPYYLRGSNITLYRFFEDPECRDLPWRRDWVQKLHQRAKDMHWNCLRYCIGFPPEAWYEVADELGLLIQDEFPLWHGGSGWSTWPKELTSAELAREYAEWMRERWNHPCVVIWDASNETASTETPAAVRQVRDLDLSHRPWDNSYSEPQEPGDVFESHPYHFNANFRLTDLAMADPVPQGNQRHNDRRHAVIINEYGWHWVNRDGTPTTLTADLYRAVLGPNATPKQRFHMQATWLAADTEFWRTRRTAAAVMHFTMLGYSRLDGQTCDHWQAGGVEALAWEPEFYRYVRDAFAPVGLSVDFWRDRLLPGTASTVPVRLINDLEQPWRGRVTLRLKKTGAKTPALEVSRRASLDSWGHTTLEFPLTWPSVTGAYTLAAELRGTDGNPVASVRELQVLDPTALGLAYGKPTSASSSYSQQYLPANAVDGDLASYWSSSFSEPAWFAVDLGDVHSLRRVRIHWENAYAKEFTLQTSLDGNTWSDAFAETRNSGGVSDIKLEGRPARQVRVLCLKRATQWGFAIREFEVFE